MFEEQFECLLQKYEDFNWSPIAFGNKYFIKEAQKEIKKGHPLYGMVMYSTAKCDSCDDVMYVIEGERYVIIHLTYAENIDIDYPHFMLFETLQDVLTYIEREYIEEYLN